MDLDHFIPLSLFEDMPNGDLTTDSLFTSPAPGRAELIAKQDLVLSGSFIFEKVAKTLDASLASTWFFADGDRILRSQTLATFSGDLRNLLKAERVGLNFLGHLSGIATLTRQFVDAIAHTPCKILDTRKTTPLYRELEKAAVRNGGGTNHRMNLSAAILIKENHIAAVGSLQRAVSLIRTRKPTLPIEVETRNLDEVQQAVSAEVQRILLDNMSDLQIQSCLEIIPDHIQVEASGNMNLSRVPSVAELGVDFISVGALTHSAPVADLSLLFHW